MKDQRIRYAKHNNRQPALSLNVGLHVIFVGQYITILGGDDEYLPDHLAVRAAYLCGHPQTDLIHGGMTIIGDQFVKNKNDMTKKSTCRSARSVGRFSANVRFFQRQWIL